MYHKQETLKKFSKITQVKFYCIGMDCIQSYYLMLLLKMKKQMF